MTEQTQTHNKSHIFLIYLVLTAGILIAYEPIRHNSFVYYDDNEYITENPDIKSTITWQSFSRAFTKPHFYMWHPITTLSHMLDYQIYGLNPLGHHTTSVLIHIANTLLLFLLLSKMTGAIWKSGFVAAAFALHPIHVESVAWAAERKDVLSGLFWMLTMLAYIHYAKRPNIKRYALVLFPLAMGLMSKPMAVTLPFALLLLDYWPLKRLVWPAAAIPEASATYRKASVWRLVAEKIPMFVMSAAVSVITFLAQKQSHAVADLKSWPLQVRIVNSLSSYFDYIVKMAWPKNLTVLYPSPERLTIDSAILAVVGAVVLLFLFGRGRQWLVAGLLWYLGTLIPVIGLVKSGEQIMADRYTYLPSIGIFIIVAWGAEEIFSPSGVLRTKIRYSKVIPALGAAAAVIAMVFMTRIQVGYWKNDLTLFGRAVAITKDNYVMHNNYGTALYDAGLYDEAVKQLREAVRILPDYPDACQNLCATLLKQGKFDEGIALLTESLQKRTDWPDIYIMYDQLGWAYEQKGNLALAEENYRKALTLAPDYEPARSNLARVLAKQGKSPEPSKAE